MIYKITFAQGHGSIRHNNRDFVACNVDQERVQDNIILCRQSLEDAYRDVFKDSIDEYNLHQKQRCRRLSVDKYIDRIRAGQDGETNPKLAYETIVQIGNRDNAGFDVAPDVAKKMANILACYYEDFVARNKGHIKVYNAVIHMDEATPHMHIDWIPFADGYKRGMQRRNSLEKAMGQLGYSMDAASKTRKRNNRSNWQDAERDQIKAICKSMGIEADYERHDQPELHLSPAEMRKIGRMVDSRYQDEAQKALEVAAKARDEYLDAFQGKGLKAILGRFRDNGKYLDRVVSAATQSQALSEAYLQTQKADLQQQQKQLGLGRQLLDDDTSRAQDIIDTAAAELAEQEQRRKALERQEQELADQRRQLDNLRQQIRQDQEKADRAKKKAEDAKEKSQAAADSLEAFKKEYPSAVMQKARVDYLEGKIDRQDRDIADLQAKLDKINKSIKSVLSEHELSLIKDTGLPLDEVLQRRINAAAEKGKKEGRDAGYDAGKAAAASASANKIKELQDKQDRLQAELDAAKNRSAAIELAWKTLTNDLRANHNIRVVASKDGAYRAKKIGIQRQHSQDKDKGMSR